MRSSGRARLAFSLVELLVVLGIIAVALGILIPAVQHARAAADRLVCQNNLKQIGLAIHNYQDQTGTFPAGFLYTPPGTTTSSGPSNQSSHDIFDRLPPSFHALQKPGWGWGALILPYLEEEPLYRELHFDLPVESSSNLQPRTQPRRVFTCPADRQTGVYTVLTDVSLPLADAATNSYAACYGALGNLGIQPDKGNGVFFRNSRIRGSEIQDGLSNTIAIGERAALFTQTPWAGVMTGGTAQTTPDAPVYISRMDPPPTMALARIGTKNLNDPFAEPYDFFSPHQAVCHFVFADGAVHAIALRTDPVVLQALATRAGQEVVSQDRYAP